MVMLHLDLATAIAPHAPMTVPWSALAQSNMEFAIEAALLLRTLLQAQHAPMVLLPALPSGLSDFPANTSTVATAPLAMCKRWAHCSILISSFGGEKSLVLQL